MTTLVIASLKPKKKVFSVRSLIFVVVSEVLSSTNRFQSWSSIVIAGFVRLCSFIANVSAFTAASTRVLILEVVSSLALDLTNISRSYNKTDPQYSHKSPTNERPKEENT